MPTMPLTPRPRVSGRPSLPKTVPSSLRYLPNKQRPRVPVPVLQSAPFPLFPVARSAPPSFRSRIPLRPVRSVAAKSPAQFPVPPWFTNAFAIPSPRSLRASTASEFLPKLPF